MRGLKAALLLLGLASCGTPGSFYAYGYDWELNPSQPDCPQGVTWIQKPPLVVPNYCGTVAGAPGMLGCVLANSCVVVSMYDAVSAKATFPCGNEQSHWDHEVGMHISRKLRHPKGLVHGC